MKLLITFFGIFLAYFCKSVFLQASVSQPPVQPQVTDEKTLTYTLLTETTGTTVQLKLGGNGYTSSTKCYIKKSSENSDNYQDIDGCPNADTTSPAAGKCHRTCVGEDNKLTFNQFSPRTKYVAIFTGDDAGATVAKTQGGTVFGLDIPLLVNPQVTITTSAERKLKLSTITCKQVLCPIYYRGVEYTKNTKSSSCTVATDVELDFDLMIPHYEMICENYPSFFYELQNKYTLDKFHVYKPQYYVKYNNDDKTKYLIKFSNKFPFEICRFSIKEESKQVTASTSDEYTSNCGGTKKDCYAPCNDVELVFTASKSVVEVMIQSRHFSLEKDNGNYLGHIQKKFVVTEPPATQPGLLSAFKPNGVTLNVPLFNPGSDPKFSTCTVTYYPADKPPPTDGVGEKAKCFKASASSAECEKSCQSLTITELLSGKPYIIVIAAAGTNSVPANFKEHIFIRTENESSKLFPQITPTLSDTMVTIKAIDGDAAITKDDVTCAYFISPRAKDIYVTATCADGYPCQGYCREPQIIVGLTPETEYDVKLVAHKDYGHKIYQITTEKSTIKLDNQFIDKGFKVVGTLSTPDPTAKCHYNVEVKVGEDYRLIHKCSIVSVQEQPAKESNLLSKISNVRGARSSSDQATLLRSKSSTISPTSCTEPILCSEILFTTNYDRSKIYRVQVTAVVNSVENTIDIPANPLPKNNDKTKVIVVSITRVEEKLKISSVLPPEVAESFCGWELRDSSKAENPLVKSCNGENDTGCESFPKCKEFEILNVPDDTDYQLTVYVSSEKSINGGNGISKGATHDTMKSTSNNTIMMIGAGVAGVIVLLVVVIVIMKKKK